MEKNIFKFNSNNIVGNIMKVNVDHNKFYFEVNKISNNNGLVMAFALIRIKFSDNNRSYQYMSNQLLVEENDLIEIKIDDNKLLIVKENMRKFVFSNLYSFLKDDINLNILLYTSSRLSSQIYFDITNELKSDKIQDLIKLFKYVGLRRLNLYQHDDLEMLKFLQCIDCIDLVNKDDIKYEKDKIDFDTFSKMIIDIIYSYKKIFGIYINIDYLISYISKTYDSINNNKPIIEKNTNIYIESKFMINKEKLSIDNKISIYFIYKYIDILYEYKFLDPDNILENALLFCINIILVNGI